MAEFQAILRKAGLRRHRRSQHLRRSRRSTHRCCDAVDRTRPRTGDGVATHDISRVRVRAQWAESGIVPKVWVRAVGAFAWNRRPRRNGSGSPDSGKKNSNRRGCRKAAGTGYHMKNYFNMVPLTRLAGASHPLPLGVGFALGVVLSASS